MNAEGLERLLYPVRGGTEVDTDLKGNFLFIDPGLGGTGWALFDGLCIRAGKPVPKPPIQWGTFTDTRGAWLARARRIAAAVAGLCHAYSTDLWLILEWVRLWGGSAKSQAGAGSGNLFKLAALTGMLAAAAPGGRCPLLIPAERWKGQLPKRVVYDRVTQAWGEEFVGINEHALDAVGMGLAAQGGL